MTVQGQSDVAGAPGHQQGAVVQPAHGVGGVCRVAREEQGGLVGVHVVAVERSASLAGGAVHGNDLLFVRGDGDGVVGKGIF